MPGSLSKIHADAVAAHKGGDLVSAEKGYLSLLAAKPDAAEIHYLLGAIHRQKGRQEDAVESLRTCVHYQPNHADALSMLGSILAGLGQDDDAIETLGKVLALTPDDPKALHNYAKACIDGKRFDLGADALAKLVHKTPDHPDAINGYATCLAELGQADKAIATLEQSIESGIATSDIYETLVRRLIDAKRFEAALKHLEVARTQWSDNNAFHLAHASVLQSTHRHDEALAAFRALVAIEPSNELILNKFSSFLHDIGRWKEAESYCRQALAISPNSVATLTNLGRIRHQRTDLDGAKILYEKALKIDPQYADAHNNMGNLMLHMAHTDTALSHFDRAIELKPQSHEFRFNRSIAIFTDRSISSGWRDHRSRFEKEDVLENRHREWPEWNGESLDGKRVLLWGEQGIGDQIIHSRAAPIIAAKTEACALECSPRLAALFDRSFPHIEIRSASAPAEQAQTFDYHCSTLDLNCSLYGTTADISPRPYLKADPGLTESLRKKYRSTLGERPLIGLSWWSGHSLHAHFKSVALKRWKDILSIPDAAFISLQYGEGRDEIAPMQSETGLNLMEDPDVDPMGDLDKFAAQVAAMDLVITISNTTAHMAGALGVPVWNMTPTGPARLWYWFLDGDTSPWYESMRVFRHAYNESWDGVLENVSNLLKQTVPEFLSADS